MDTTGAGDCFTGAYAVATLEGLEGGDALQFAGRVISMVYKLAICLQALLTGSTHCFMQAQDQRLYQVLAYALACLSYIDKEYDLRDKSTSYAVQQRDSCNGADDVAIVAMHHYAIRCSFRALEVICSLYHVQSCLTILLTCNAAAAASICVQREGAMTSLPSRQEVEQLLKTLS